MILGHAGTVEISIDLDRLIETRLLVQGSSGCGKSGLVRRLLEQTHGRAQHLVLDVEGEYATLRERFDYVLAGPGGDCPADIRSAALLARRLLELGTSAIVDLHEMRADHRSRFVRLFLEALLGAPKALWHDALVVVEEAHLWAPQSGRESESTTAMVDLATRGRKRGFAFVGVTQRISDLHKSVVAQCGNRLIGRTTLDADVKRSAYDLGFGGREEARQLAALARREFFAFGPAISDRVVRFRVADTSTTAGVRRGERAAAPPPAPERVRQVLGKLADLPKEAEQEAQDLEGARRRVRDLERELAAARAGKPDPAAVEAAVAAARRETGEEADRRLVRIVERIRTRDERASKAVLDVSRALAGVADLVEVAYSAITGTPDLEADAIARQVGAAAHEPARPATRSALALVAKAVAAGRPAAMSMHAPPARTGGERRMLEILAQYFPSGLREGQWAALAGLKRTGGTWGTYKSRLRVAGLLREEDGLFFTTPEGAAQVGSGGRPSSTEELLEIWESKPGMRPVIPMVRAVLAAGALDGRCELERTELAKAVNLSAAGGTFGTYLSRARTAELLRTEGSTVQLGAAFEGLP